MSRLKIYAVILILFATFTVHASEKRELFRYVPPTVSKVWKPVYEAFPDPKKALDMPKHNDIKAWRQIHEMIEKERIPKEEKAAHALGVAVAEKTLGGTPVLVLTPRNLQSTKKIIVYTHGGAYTMLSARSTLGAAALIASGTRLKVISVDYTNPPSAGWRDVTDQVVSVIDALRKDGYAMSEIALMGDSAGGALAAGVALKLRDEDGLLPAALVLWSPWADITRTGESYVTLEDAEPRFIYQKVLKPSADAYADPKEQKHPYVSPVYGDFSKGFPPTLIQGGTREIFLSNFVRLYQAIDTAGGVVKLDLYEGMPHVFQATLPQSPETKIAMRKVTAFLKKYLGN
jgi:acetyl esterase/lipase